MKSRIIVSFKKHPAQLPAICAAIILVSSVLFCVQNRNTTAVFSTATERMEPETPADIDDPPYPDLPSPTKIRPVGEVIAAGKEIPLKYAYHNPEWKRPAYRSYWHSSLARWSYVPNRIHYAMHRMFITYPTASVFYDFVHNLGIAEESAEFQIPQNPFQNIVLAVMQTQVEQIRTLGNQVAVVGKPSITGLQVLLIPVRDLNPDQPKESLLFQLVTKDGDIIDETKETYVSDE